MAEKDLFARGATELFILSALNEQDMYTYQISQKIQEQSDNRFNLSESILYSILYKFSKAGYVSEWTEVVKRRIRVYYHLEDSGKEYYKRCLSSYKEISQYLNQLLAEEEE